jgi:hypothetical protein
MAAPRPKKTTVVKKKPPVVKKKPSFLRKDTPRPARDVKPGDLRSQTLTNDNKPRPARDLNKGGLRAQYLKSANAGGGSAVARGGSAVARGLIKKTPVVGAALGFIADAAPAGTGSDKPVGSVMKSNMPGGYGTKTSGYGPTPKKKYSSPIGPDKYKRRAGAGPATYSDIPRERTAKYNPGDYAKYRSGQSKVSMSGGGVNNPSGKSSGDALRRAGAGTFTASYDVKANKSGPSNTAATAAASSGGGSQAAGVAKKKSRPPTRYQRNETAMEQRKSPSGKPKKSIFTSGKPKKSILSLFRKG